MISLLGITLDYMLLEKSDVRGDVWLRQRRYAELLARFHVIAYAPKKRADRRRYMGDGGLTIAPSDSANRATFIFDALRAGWMACKRERFDAITTEDPFVTGLVGLILKKRFGLPLNVQVHNDFFDNPFWLGQRVLNRVYNVLGKFVLRRADTVRVGTTYEKAKLARLGVSSDRVRVLPVHADVKKFSILPSGFDRDGFKRARGLDRFDGLVVSTGRVTAQKDFPMLIRAMALVFAGRPRAGLCILGDGAEMGALKAEVERLGLSERVVLPGAVPHDDVAKFIAVADVYAMPSIFEGTCIALAEAAISGRAVVATSFAGAYDLIDDGRTGFRVPIRDHEAMAKKIGYLLDNPDVAKRMGMAAREHVSGLFSEERNIRGVVRMWEDTAGARPLAGKRP